MYSSYIVGIVFVPGFLCVLHSVSLPPASISLSDCSVVAVGCFNKTAAMARSATIAFLSRRCHSQLFSISRFTSSILLCVYSFFSLLAVTVSCCGLVKSTSWTKKANFLSLYSVELLYALHDLRFSLVRGYRI